MSAGEKRWRITIETCVEVRTGTGSVTYQWNKLAEVWAARRPVKASEQTFGNQVLTSADVVWTIRWASILANLGTKSRIKLQTGDRYETLFNIVGVLETKPRRELTIYTSTGHNVG